jgi:hypothetical protein
MRTQQAGVLSRGQCAVQHLEEDTAFYLLILKNRELSEPTKIRHVPYQSQSCPSCQRRAWTQLSGRQCPRNGISGKHITLSFRQLQEDKRESAEDAEVQRPLCMGRTHSSHASSEKATANQPVRPFTMPG